MLSGSSPTTTLSAEQLLDRFATGSPRQRRNLIRSIESRVDELAALGPALFQPFDPGGDDWAVGWILQVLQRHSPDKVPSPTWLDTPSGADIDFTPLQHHLLREDFEEADRVTSALLRQLAGEQAVRRGYVYFSEVAPMSGIDLTTLDRLWIVFSQGRFGFSVQWRLLQSFDGRYDQLWPRIGWKTDGVWTRYPGAFDWSLKAPEGHMPLINQLRGVRLMDALLNHPALVARRPT